MNDLNKSWVNPCFTDTTQQPLLLVVPARFFQYNPEYIFYAQLDAQYLYSLRIPSDFVLLGQKLKKPFFFQKHIMCTLFMKVERYASQKWYNSVGYFLATGTQEV